MNYTLTTFRLNSLFRNLTTRQLVVIGLIVPILCTLVVGWFQWHAVNDLLRGRILTRQIRATQVALGAFRYSLSDAESSQFRYILTHNSADLDFYRQLLAEAQAQFGLLRQYTTGNDLETKYLDQIEPLLKSKEDATEQSFAMEQGGNHAGALAIISSDASRQNMLQIEGAIHDMESICAQFVILRQNIYLHNLKVTTAASVAGLAVNLVCIAAVLLIIRRMQQLQASVTSDALRELVNYEDGKLTIEEYLSRRAAALSAHGQAQIEAEKIISQIERRKARSATQRVPTTPAPPK